MDDSGFELGPYKTNMSTNLTTNTIEEACIDQNNVIETTMLSDGDNLKQQTEEEKMFTETFTKLGAKLTSAYKVVQSAKNMHKSVRDDITCAMALYKQIKELKKTTTYPFIGLTSKEVEVAKRTIGTQSIENKNEGKRSRAAQLDSPEGDRHPKKRITVETPRTIEAPTIDTGDGNEWRRVNSRKKKKKVKSMIKHNQGEAITIKPNTETTYADMLKAMKSNINPTEIGIEIKSMRRTRTGDILVQFNKGERQAEKLTRAIENTLGNDVTIKTVTKSCRIDIRDMDETTEKEDIQSALATATNVNEADVKVLNIRESYASTRQALIQVPENVAAILLQAKKVRIGWVICRVRKKAKPTQCYRCLDQGHRANECKGKDRSDVCKKCCLIGHKARDCKGQARCDICQDAGLEDVNHYIGSTICVNNRKDNQRNE